MENINLQGKILQLFYRIIAPKNPRGWLNFYFDREDGSVFCTGMEKWNLSNIYFANVPKEMTGYAHGMAFDILYYIKNVKPIKDSENFGGTLVSEDQIILHLATMYEEEIFKLGQKIKVLKVVDHKEPRGSGFAKKLFATHLLTLSDTVYNPEKRIELLEKSISLYSGDVANVSDIDNTVVKGSNDNNFVSYWVLSDNFFELGKKAEFVEYTEKAIARCPAWALNYSNDMREEFGNSLDSKHKKDERFVFWKNLSREKIIEIVEKYNNSK